MNALAAHIVTVDYSSETGAIMACSCGLAVGPFLERGQARAAAKEHTRWTERDRDRQRHARKAAARRATRGES